MAAQRAIDGGYASQGGAEPFVETDRAGRSRYVATKSATCTVEHQAAGLTMPQAAMEHCEQHAGIETPAECAATSCCSMHILCPVFAVIENGEVRV